jgi:hypothetical protein
MKNKQYNDINYFAVRCNLTGFFRIAQGKEEIPFVWGHNNIEIIDLGKDKTKAFLKLLELEKVANEGS